MNEKLIVPALSGRRHWLEGEARDADVKMERGFREAAEAYFDSLLPSDWRTFLKFKIEAGTAFLCDGSGWGTGHVFRRVKARKEFTLSADHVQKIGDHIQAIKADRARKDAANKLQRRLEKLVSAIEGKYATKERRMSVSRNGLEIHENGCEVIVGRDGDITEVRCWVMRSRRATLEEIREYLAEYEPKVNALRQLADQIKAELPAEFFEQETAIPANAKTRG